MTPEQRNDIEEFGIFWGLVHNFDPHITIVYDSGKDREGINIQQCIEKIKPSSGHMFYGKSIAVGELGPAGNVVNIINTIKLLETPPSFGDHRIFSNGKSNANKSNSQASYTVSEKKPISKL